MEELNSYLGMADNDRAYAIGSVGTSKELQNWNGTVSLAMQAAEKYMKAVIELSFENDAEAFRLLHSHNLRALYNKITSEYVLDVTSIECKWLGDFYWDARYPGDNFVKCSENDSVQALDILERIRLSCIKALEKEQEHRNDMQKALGALKAF